MISKEAKRLIDSIRFREDLVVLNSQFCPIAMAIYSTLEKPGEKYIKVFSDNNLELVFDMKNNSMLFGENIGKLDINEPFGNSVSYKQELFKLVATGKQKLLATYFGIPEGDVEFWDFENSRGDTLSLAITSNRERADVLLREIKLSDVGLK